ncbi:MAG TPA: hypothetical protein PLG14_01910 [Spirochaetales bacterium]|nr:hypothetical protein [Spirochaetales bacterium]
MRKGFSTVLYLFIGLPLTLSALLCLSMKPWVLDRDFYKRFATDDRLYAALRSPEAAKGVEARLEVEGAVFSGPELVAAFQPRIPEAELKALGSSAVDQVFDALESRGRAESLLLDLKPLKAALSKSAPSAAADYAKAIPVRAEKAEAGDFSFRPEGSSVEATARKVGAAFQAAAAQIPDQAEEKELRVDAGLPMGRSLKAAFDSTTLTLSLLSALLVAGLALMAGGGAGAVLSRAGSYLIPPSVLVLVPGILLSLPGNAIFGRIGTLPPEAASFLSSEAGASLAAYLRAVLGQMSRGFFVTGLVGVSVGAALKALRRAFEPSEI